jgi:3-methyl-2-oxobutanoate hydroxymethyltransferase
MGEKITISDLSDAKEASRKFTAVSCYDYTSARLVAETPVEMILVGDSASQFMLGYDSTLPVTMDFMVAITAAVRRAAPKVCLAADMPFLSYQVSVEDAVRNAGRFYKEASADIIKIEATEAHLPVIKAVSNADMAVMAHIGLRPQSIAKTGKLKAEGTGADTALKLIKLSEQMVDAGACMILLEGTAREVAKIITEKLPVPVLSCGSGPDCDGQILVLPDILGLGKGQIPKFSKCYGQIDSEIDRAVRAYDEEVKSGNFPDDARSYHIKTGELAKLQDLLKAEKL